MKVLIFRIALVSLLISLFSTVLAHSESMDNATHIYRAVVLGVESSKDYSSNSSILHVQFEEGPFKDQQIKFLHTPIVATRSDVPFRKGMRILISLQASNGEIIGANFYDIARTPSLKLLFIVFFTLLIVFGGFRGVRSGLALVFTFILIIFVLIPLILKGYNPILTTIITSSVIIFTSFLLITGLSQKSLCAILGTVGGTIIAGLLAFYFGNLIALTGLSDEYMQTLVAYRSMQIDYRGLLFSGIIIGTIGAIMDVSMSITSFVFEIKSKQPSASWLSLFASGLNVGKDIMGTMANTLILAYAGASLPLFLLFVQMNLSFSSVLNTELIAEEVVRSLCGSIGLIMAIPLTSLIASLKA